MYNVLIVRPGAQTISFQARSPFEGMQEVLKCTPNEPGGCPIFISALGESIEQMGQYTLSEVRREVAESYARANKLPLL